MDSEANVITSYSIHYTKLYEEPHPAATESAAQLLHDVKGVVHVQILGPCRIKVSYNVRQITMQIIEALLGELGYSLQTGFS